MGIDPGTPANPSRSTKLLHRFIDRLVDVIIDGLVQAAAVALAVFVLTLIWAWRGHLHGIWLERAIGALIATFLIALVLDVIAIFRESATARVRRKKSMSSEKGFLDFKLEAETAMAALPDAVNKLARIMERVAPAISPQADKLLKATSTKDQLAASRAASDSLDRISRRFDGVLSDLESLAALLFEGMNGWSQWIEEKSGANRSSFLSFMDSLRTLIQNLQNSIDQNEAYINTMTKIKGTSSALNAATDRHIRIVEKIRIATVRIQAACSEMLRRLDNLPDESSS
jgi:hypothetical protein